MSMQITFPGGLRVNATAGAHTIQTDQGRLSGGEGSAPEPFTMFLASIGTCAGIYVLRFLESRGISTEGVVIDQDLEYDQAARRVKSISLDIKVPDTVPAKYHDALVRSASQCAVKRTILDPPEFSIRTVAA